MNTPQGVSSNRKEVLLRAALDMLVQCRDSHFVLDVMSVTVFYDEAECDGSCLLQDIATELNLDPDYLP